MTTGFTMMALAGPANADKGGTPNNNSNGNSNGNNENNGNAGGNGNGNGKPDQENDKKVNVCHATSSMTNPYVFINVSENAVKSQGHRMHREDPNKIWKDGAWWNGTWYPAGSDRRDWINSFVDKDGDTVTLDGIIVTEEWCEADPTGPREVTPAVTSSNPCGTANDTFSVVAEPTRFTSQANGTAASGSVSIQFTALPGYTIGGSNPVVLTFTNAPCEGLIAVRAAIDIEDPCGTRNDSVDGVDKAGYTFEVDGNEVTFEAEDGYVLTGPDVLVADFNEQPCPVVGPTDVCPNIGGNQAEVPDGLVKVNGQCAEIAGTETSSPKPDMKPEVRGTEAVPTAVDAGIGGSGPTVSGSSPIGLLAQMLVGGGLALLMAAGWLQIGRQTQGEHLI